MSTSRAKLNYFSRSLTAIVPMKSSNAFVVVCSKKMSKMDGHKIRLWQTLTVV